MSERDSYVSISLHAPKTAKFRNVTDFCIMDIEGNNGNPIINILLTDNSRNSLLFLYQLREAVEKAFQYFLNRED